MVCPRLWGWSCVRGGVGAGGGGSLLLLPALQKWHLSSLVFLYLSSRICPNCACTVAFHPRWFLCILLLQERCVQVQVLQQRVPGPSPAQ